MGYTRSIKPCLASALHADSWIPLLLGFRQREAELPLEPESTTCRHHEDKPQSLRRFFLLGACDTPYRLDFCRFPIPP